MSEPENSPEAMDSEDAARSSSVLSLTIRDKGSLHTSYMPFVKGGGLFIPTSRQYQMGEEVFMLLTLLDQPENRSAGKATGCRNRLLGDTRWRAGWTKSWGRCSFRRERCSDSAQQDRVTARWHIEIGSSDPHDVVCIKVSGGWADRRATGAQQAVRAHCARPANSSFPCGRLSLRSFFVWRNGRSVPV